MRTLPNSSRQACAACVAPLPVSACADSVIAKLSTSQRHAPPFENRIGDEFRGFGAGLRAAIAVLLDGIADTPQPLDSGLARQVIAGAASLCRPIVAHHADGEDLCPIKVRKL